MEAPLPTPGMTLDPLVLRPAGVGDEPEVLGAYRAAQGDVRDFLHYYRPGMPFAAYVETLEDQARGLNLPPNHVPSTFLFAFKGHRVVGRVSIRHELNDFLCRLGGHIGYAVVPEFRRQGHATEMLRQALQIAHGRLGINPVLVTCDDDNVGSMRTIERNGGVLENVVVEPDYPKPKRRYWITDRSVGSTTIRPEQAGDASGVRAVHLQSFPTDGEARLVDALRDAGRLVCSVVATDDDRIVGHAGFSPISLDGAPAGVGLAPVAVLPHCRRRGIAAGLIRTGLDACRTAGHAFVVVLGDPSYYGRFGFVAASRYGLRGEYGNGPEFQVLPLRSAGVPETGGLVRYAEEFRALA